MADVIITVTDPDTGVSTVFESLQLDSNSEEAPKKQEDRPKHRDRGSRSNTTSITLPFGLGFQLDDDLTQLKPCSYYRQKYCCGTRQDEIPQDLNYWINYMRIKKSAGDKVVRKMASQQQRLAAEAAEQKKAPSHKFFQDEKAADTKTQPFKRILPHRMKPLKLEPLRVFPTTSGNQSGTSAKVRD